MQVVNVGIVNKIRFIVYLSIVPTSPLLLIRNFFAIIISIVETIGIGSLVGYVMMLQDPYEYIQKIPFENFKFYLKQLDVLTIAIYSSAAIVIFFLFKNLALLFFYYCEGKVQKNILRNQYADS